MSTRTRAARRWASWQWMTRTMTSVFCAAGVAAALVMATPTAVADPEQDPGNPLPPAPVVEAPPLDPLAAPVAPPLPDVLAPPVHPSPTPPAAAGRAPPPGAGVRAPRGGTDPRAVHRHAAVQAADVQPEQRLDGRRG